MDKGDKIVEEYVPFKTKINYCLGSLSNNILNGFVFANLTFFYQVKLGLTAELLAIGWLIFAVWNTLNDPIASYLIDNTRTKIGRRIPYIRYGSFLYGLAFIVCWFPIAPLNDQIALFINFLVALFLLDTMFTFVGACYFSLPNEIAVSAKERASISVYTAFASFGQIVIGVILPIILFTGQKGLPPYFNLIIIMVGVICSITLFITSFFIKENMFAQMQPYEGLVEGIKLTFKNRPFWILMISMFCIYLVYPTFQTGFLYYLEFVIGGQPVIYFVVFLLIGIILGMILTIKLISLWHPKKTVFFNLCIVSIGLLSLFFIGRNSLLASISSFLVGIGLAGALISIPVVLGDTIDNDELITGKRREAVYGGVNAIVTKPAISLANWIFLFILSIFGFIAGKETQSDLAITGILVALSIIPAIILGFSAIIFFLLYPLDGPEWRKKKDYIVKLHEEKEKAYLQTLAKEGKLSTKSID